METYFSWLPNVMSAFPWVQKLSQAKNFEQVVKIQTGFMEAQRAGKFNKRHGAKKATPQVKKISQAHIGSIASMVRIKSWLFVAL
jgi:hypothetical protein